MGFFLVSSWSSRSEKARGEVGIIFSFFQRWRLSDLQWFLDTTSFGETDHSYDRHDFYGLNRNFLLVFYRNN